MDATDTFDWISARMVAGQPFEVVLRGESLNEWLAAAPVSWPDMAEAIPPQVRGMALRLREGGLSLGVRYADERWESIVSVDTSLAMSPDGSSLVVRPMGVRVGAVHVPLEWIAAAAAAVGPMDIRELERSGLRSPTGPITKPADFAQGVVFDNAFVWPNGERSFRIDALDIDERTARIRVSPMGR